MMTPPLWLSAVSLVAILLGCEAAPRPALPTVPVAALTQRMDRAMAAARLREARAQAAYRCAYAGWDAACDVETLACRCVPPNLGIYPLPPPERPRPAVARAE